MSGDYIWKYTNNAFDFSVLGNTPITFPIDWHNSKITGFTLRTDVPSIHGVSAFVVMSSVAARFFPPQTAGAGATVGQSGLPFRIDHDEKYNQTTHLQYQFPHGGPWFGFNWRYDSGLVAGSVPCYVSVLEDTLPRKSTTLNGVPAVDLGKQHSLGQSVTGKCISGLTADQQFQAGLTCNGVKFAPTEANHSPADANAPPRVFKSTLVKIPAPGTENDDHNPPRIASAQPVRYGVWRR